MRDIDLPSQDDYPNPLSEERITKFLSSLGSILKQLYAIHKAGFVHGDIKPANIILARDDLWYIIDFDWASPIGTPWRTERGTPGFCVSFGASHIKQDLH